MILVSITCTLDSRAFSSGAVGAFGHMYGMPTIRPLKRKLKHFGVFGKPGRFEADQFATDPLIFSEEHSNTTVRW